MSFETVRKDDVSHYSDSSDNEQILKSEPFPSPGNAAINVERVSEFVLSATLRFQCHQIRYQEQISETMSAKALRLLLASDRDDEGKTPSRWKQSRRRIYLLTFYAQTPRCLVLRLFQQPLSLLYLLDSCYTARDGRLRTRNAMVERSWWRKDMAFAI